nr:oocyte zinc finger protein XlCOF19-like [Labrus bergylta]
MEWRVEGLTRSQNPSLLCLSSGESTWDISAHTTSPVTMDKVNLSQQNSWSGVQQMDHFSDQNLVYQSINTQNQNSLSQEPSLPFTCSICSRRFSHHCKLRIHERAHTGEKPHKCPQCDKRFGQMCSLKRHQMVHTGERPFPCPHCGKAFATSTNLKVHQSVHTGERRFNCSKCGKNFSFLSNLIRHQALHRNK